MSSELLLFVGAGGAKNGPDELSAPVCALLQDVGGGSCAQDDSKRNQPQIMRGTLEQVCHKTGGHMRINEAGAEFSSRLTGIWTSSFRKRGGDGKDTFSSAVSSSSLSDRQASSVRGLGNVSDALRFTTVQPKRC